MAVVPALHPEGLGPLFGGEVFAGDGGFAAVVGFADGGRNAGVLS